jgi:ubiquinone/menaquinone biosynthesis C-methylase UbiE
MYSIGVTTPTDSEAHAHPLAPVYSPNLYKGTAEYYTRFRPRYPAVLVDAIERTVGLGPEDSLLDLACGTGEVSLAFADRVGDIWAIDLEPEMVAMAEQNALYRGIRRVHWLVGRAEDAELPEDHFTMVAAGRAFHRLNRPLIAQRGLRWLRSGGRFIDMGADSSGLRNPTEPWMAAAAEVYDRWLPQARKSRAEVTTSSAPGQRKATTQTILMEAGYTQVTKHEFDVPLVWEIDRFIGYLRSLSFSTKEFWGEAWSGFEADLRNTLATFTSTDRLTETISAYFVVGQKP